MPAEVRPIVEAAISVVREARPGVEEVAYDMKQPRSPSMMWKLVRFRTGGTNVAGVGCFRHHASLFFYRGIELDDPEGLLAGRGKESRYVTLRSAEEARRPAVAALVRQAFALPSK
ncbi:MAG TPA: DUF1801 domain-containing protein [Candidatus Dormibacteraeota bacterium]